MNKRTIMLGDIEVNKSLKEEEFNGVSGYEKEVSREGECHFKSKRPVAFIGGRFDVDVYFERGRLVNIILEPADGEVEKDTNDAVTQRVKFEYCAALMEGEWGRPVFKDRVNRYYKFTGCDALCALALDSSKRGGGRIILIPQV